MMILSRQVGGLSQPNASVGVAAAAAQRDAARTAPSFHETLAQARDVSRRSAYRTPDRKTAPETRESDRKTDEKPATEHDNDTDALSEREATQPEVTEQPAIAEQSQPDDAVAMSDTLLAHESRLSRTMQAGVRPPGEQAAAKAAGNMTAPLPPAASDTAALPQEGATEANASQETLAATAESKNFATAEESAAALRTDPHHANPSSAMRSPAPVAADVGAVSGTTAAPAQHATASPPRTNIEHPFASMQATNESETDSANVARVARGLQSAMQQNGGSVTLRLHPPELGFVRIEMQVANGTVSATLQSELPQVRELLHQQLAHLRNGLEGHGLNVERLQVQGPPSANANHGFGDTTGDHRAPTDDGRSRGHLADSGRRREGSPRDERRDSPRHFAFADVVNELA